MLLLLSKLIQIPIKREVQIRKPNYEKVKILTTQLLLSTIALCTVEIQH